MTRFNRLFFVFALVFFVAAGVTLNLQAAAGEHKTQKFMGPQANTGMAIHVTEGGKSILRVTPDFKVPDTPAPTWRVVDSSGAIYTLDAFKIQGGEKREVVVPAYVKDIAKVQVYCAWAEVLLGEAGFSAPVK
jgi:hypothetical protein